MRINILCFLFFFCIPTNTLAQFSITGDFTDVHSFEAAVPETWTTDANGSLNIATDRYKHGTQSLEWQWTTANSTITVTDSDLTTNSNFRNSGMNFWIYSEDNLQDSILLNFYSEADTKLCSFYYRINFEGWRGQWINFWEDLGKHRDSIITRMEIIAPSNTNSGKLWFDLIKYNTNTDWSRVGSWQFDKPYTTDPTEAAPRHLAYMTNYLRYQQAGPKLASKPTVITASMIADVNAIEQRMDEFIVGTNYMGNAHYNSRVRQIQTSIQDAHADFESLNITANVDGIYTGMPIYGPMHKTSTANRFHPNVQDVAILALKLAYDFRLNNNSTSRNYFIQLLDYAHQQGWAAGSSLGALHYIGLYTVDFPLACFLMRNELKNEPWGSTNKLERTVQTAFWHGNLSSIFTDVNDPININADDIFRNYNHAFWAVLMMEDTDINKYWYLDQFKEQVEQVILNPTISEQVLAGNQQALIRPDFTGYHHFGPALDSYFLSAMNELFIWGYFLDDTQYSFNTAVDSIFKGTALMFRFVSQQYDFPKSISMRWSGKNHGRGKILNSLALAAQINSTNGTPDAELTAAFWRLYQPDHSEFRVSAHLTTLGEYERTLWMVDNTTPSVETLSGIKVQPYASLASFRGPNNSLVSVKGFSKYVWGHEACCSENVHGGFDGYGQISILLEHPTASSQLASGLTYDDGYDWKFVPGATTIDLPISDLDDFAYWQKQDATFVGGVSHQEKNGIWAMELSNDPHIADNQFKKSVFFFGNNELIHIGSGISNPKTENTITTLFQLKIEEATPSNQPTYLAGNAITTFPYTNSSLTGSVTLKDPYGNGYYISDAANLTVDRTTQNSYNINNLNPESGNWSKAYFNHGVSPTDGGYEYVTLVQATDTQITNFAASPTYQVMQKDKLAHIVKYTPQKQTGYAIFDANTTFPVTAGLLRKVTIPLLLMVEEIDKDHVEMSITNPELSTTTGQTSTFEIRGKWNVTNTLSALVSAITTDTTTIFTLNHQEGRSYDLNLERIPSCKALSFNDLTNQSIDSGTSTHFEITVTGEEGNLSYQWQVVTNAGNDFSDVMEGANYMDVNMNKLTLNNVPTTFNQQGYRVIIKDEIGGLFCQDTSNAVVLTVQSMNTDCETGIVTMPDEGINLIPAGNYEDQHQFILKGQIENGISVNVTATNNVSLLPGFSAKAGCNFLAKIGTCNSLLGEDISLLTAKDFSLEQASLKEVFPTLNVYPNPTSNQSTIAYYIPKPATVSLALTNSLGQLIEKWHQQDNLEIGTYKTTINTTNLFSGLYFITLKIDDNIMTKRLIVN